MSVLLATPYNLNFDALVVVRATAKNSYGFALNPSVANSEGARIRISPSQMAAPTIVLHTDTSWLNDNPNWLVRTLMETTQNCWLSDCVEPPSQDVVVYHRPADV